MTLLSETRERFVRAILAQVPVDRIAEVHFFQPIKQGGVETGVAVVAAWPQPEPAEPTVVADPAEPEALAESDVDADNLLEEEATAELEESVVSDEPGAMDESAEATEDESPEREPRPIVYTARYRLTLKGPDRGKWETNVVEEAEAPLVTVEAVVRGVQRRAGDAEDAVRMSGEELREALPEPQHPAA